MSRIIVLSLALLLSGGTELVAQLQSSQSEPAVEQSLLSEVAQAELRGESSAWDRIGRHAAFTLGFGLVGSGFGYFASQVAYSDWDKVNNSTFAKERRTFSLTGAAIGLVSGFIIGARELNRGPVDSRLALRQELAGTDRILGVELRQSRVTNAYEAVQTMRPSWLVTRGTHQFTDNATGVASDRDVLIIPGAGTIRVYIDNTYLGDVDAMRSIPIGTVISIEWLEPAEATLRWGGGHTHGAIVVRTLQD